MHAVRMSVYAGGEAVGMFGALQIDTAAMSKPDLERAARIGAFWEPMLNALVRMQRIFLARFTGDDPACFRRYVPARRVLRGNTGLVKDIVAAGTDQSTLAGFMADHAAHVARRGGRDCFD